MSIKFPDMQVLIGRADQIPKILKEGDPTGAGKLAPEIMQEFNLKPKKVLDSPKSARLKNKKKDNKSKKESHESGKGSNLDIRA